MSHPPKKDNAVGALQSGRAQITDYSHLLAHRQRYVVEIGALTVERIVNGQYEWRDAEYAATKGMRKRFWEAWHA